MTVADSRRDKNLIIVTDGESQLKNPRYPPIHTRENSEYGHIASPPCLRLVKARRGGQRKRSIESVLCLDK
jgi:hypothetical protein